jgi:hypothetical protein
MIRRGCRFDEANDATTDEADVANKPAEAVEAEAYEADAKVDEADEAIVADEIKDAKAAVEANVSDEFETDRVDEAELADK